MKTQKSKIKLHLMLLGYCLGKMFIKSAYLLALLVFVGPSFVLLHWGLSLQDFFKVLSIFLIAFPFVLEFYFKKKVPRAIINSATKEADDKMAEIKSSLKN